MELQLFQLKPRQRMAKKKKRRNLETMAPKGLRKGNKEARRAAPTGQALEKVAQDTAITEAQA